MRKKRLIFLIFIISFCLDFFVKLVIKFNLEVNSVIKVIPGFFSINYVENNGGAFSILEGKSLLLIVVSILFLIYFIKVLCKDNRNTKLNIVSYGLILGGICGNLFDRIFYHKVIDYLSFKIFSYYFPIFNIADICIVIGIILYILDIILEGKEEWKIESDIKKMKDGYNGKNSSGRK